MSLEQQQILELIKGDALPEGITLGDLLSQYQTFVESDPAWTQDEYLAFIKDGIIRLKTESGVWVNDVTRAERTVKDWTTIELEAWGRGEIKGYTSGNTDGRIANELNRRLSLTNKTDVNSIRAAYLKTRERIQAPAIEPVTQLELAQAELINHNAYSGISHMNAVYIESQLKYYTEAVMPRKPCTDAEGATAQRKLEAAFVKVMNLPAEELTTGLNIVFDYVRNNLNGVFSPSMAYRFTHMLRPEVRNRHCSLIEAFRVYADPLKAKRKQVDLRSLLKEWNETQQQCLLEYFSRIK